MVGLVILLLTLAVTGCASATPGRQTDGTDVVPTIFMVALAFLLVSAALTKLGRFIARVIASLSRLLEQVLRMAGAALMLGIVILVAWASTMA